MSVLSRIRVTRSLFDMCASAYLADIRTSALSGRYSPQADLGLVSLLTGGTRVGHFDHGRFGKALRFPDTIRLQRSTWKSCHGSS